MYEKCALWSVFSCLLTFPGLTKEQIFTSIAIAQHLYKVRLIDRNTKISVVEELLRFRSFRIRAVTKLGKKPQKTNRKPNVTTLVFKWEVENKLCMNSRTEVLKCFPCFICLPFAGKSGKVTGSSSECVREKSLSIFCLLFQSRDNWRLPVHKNILSISKETLSEWEKKPKKSLIQM